MTRLIPFLLLLTAACTRPEMPSGSATAQVVGVREVAVGGVTYKVSRQAGRGNGFRVTTAGQRRGSKRDAASAVAQAYGCQRVQLTETEKGWRAADAVGSFCTSRAWLPLR